MKPRFQLGAAYAPLLSNTDQFVLVEGQRGTSKTRSILCIFMALGLKYPGSRILLCRNHRTDLTETVLATLEEEVFPIFGLTLPGGAHRRNREDYQLYNGTTFFPVGVDEGNKLLSRAATYAYVAEAIEIAESKVRDIAGCMRHIRSPENPQLPEQPRIILDTNPGPPGHYLNLAAEPASNELRRITTKKDYQRLQAYNRRPTMRPGGLWKRFITKHQDNPGYWDHDAWDFKSLGRTYVTQTLETLIGHRRKRWLMGEWASAEGAVYPEFDEDKHVCEPFEIPPHWPCIVAEDPGYDHPTAILVGAIAPNERLYICAESVRRETKIEDDATVVSEFRRVFNVRKMLGDPHYMFSKTKHSSGKTIAMQMADFGHDFTPAKAASNQTEIAQQVELVRTRLATLGRDGLPKLQVFRSCPKTISGFQTWAYVRDTAGDITGGEDRFEDTGDDEMDDVRMIVADLPEFAGEGYGAHDRQDEDENEREAYEPDREPE